MTRRRRLRIILLIAGVPLAVAGLAFALKFVSMPVIASASIADYEAGSFDDSVSDAEGLLRWNAFEPWVAHFDRGTAYAGGGLYNEAIIDLERAFDAAPDDRKCEVAVNLALSWERLGDAYLEQGQFAGAERLYETSRAAIEAAGPECLESDSTAGNSPRVPGEELRDAGSRVESKADDARGLDEQRQQEAEPAPGDQLDRLEQQNQDAADEKAQQENQERGGPIGGEFTDRPW